MNQNEQRKSLPILQVLIGAACIVVIAWGSYFAWGEYKRWQIVQSISDNAKALEAAQSMQKQQDALEAQRKQDVLACNASVTKLIQAQALPQYDTEKQKPTIASVNNCLDRGLIHKEALGSLKLQ